MEHLGRSWSVTDGMVLLGEKQELVAALGGKGRRGGEVCDHPVPGAVQGAALGGPQPCPGVLNCPAAGLECGRCGL